MAFLIRDRRYRDGLALWWKPEGHGYTTNVDEAGRFKERPYQWQDSIHEAVSEEGALALSHRVADAARFPIGANSGEPRPIEPDGGPPQ